MVDNNNKGDDISIAKAGEDDLCEILSLQKIAFLSEAERHGNYDIEPLKQTLESVSADYQTHSFLKAVHDNRIVGSVKYSSDKGIVWVGKLMVSPAYRRRGLGRRLLLEVEKANPGATGFQLFTAACSEGNIRLYESLGYKIVREYKDNSQAGIVMVEMRK